MTVRTSGKATATSFRPISAGRAFEEVIDQITFAVRAGRYRPGDRLPRIEDLSAVFRVSKPTVVEALKVLSKAGVLATQRGATGGITVVSAEIPHTILGLARPYRATLRDLLEARRAVETRLAVLCGQRATGEDFELLADAVQLLEESGEEGSDSPLYSDHLFHYTMGRAAGSEVLATYQHQIMEQLEIIYHARPELHGDYEAGLHHHRRTLAALRRRKPGPIERAMDDHLTPLEEAVAELGLDEEQPVVSQPDK